MWMLLHGFTGSPRSWDEVVARADFDQEPVLPTLVGHGPDWRRGEPRGFDAEASHLASMALGLRRPRFVCGYSMGGRVALGMLIRHPELWDAALLIGVHPGLADEPARAARRAVDSDRAQRLRGEGIAAFVADWGDLPLFQSQRNLSSMILEKQDAIRLSHDAHGLAHALEVIGLAEMPNYGAMLSSLAVPTTLMAGACDAKFSEVACALAEASSHIDAMLVEGVGHNVVLEAPEAVATALNGIERRMSR